MILILINEQPGAARREPGEVRGWDERRAKMIKDLKEKASVGAFRAYGEAGFDKGKATANLLDSGQPLTLMAQTNPNRSRY